MEVRCERCRAQYVFSDDQVGEHGLTVRCSNCGHLFKVKRKALVVTLPVGPEETGATAVSAADAHRAAAVQAAAQAVFAETERRDWSLRQPAGQTYTFKDMSTLHRWIVERKAHREDEISRASEPWRRLGSIPELQSFFAVVEAAERAAHVTVPAAQPTMLQFPATGYPGPGNKPAPARTDQVFPPQAPTPGKTEFFAAPPPPATPATPTAGRTEFFTPPQQPPPPAAPASPAAGRTEFFAPPPPVARPAAEKAIVPPPPPVPAAPTSSRLDGIFTPDPMPVHEADPFAVPVGGATAEQETEQGIPPPPPPSAAPQRSPTAAWEGQRATPAQAPSREPAWTTSDQQTGGTIVEQPPEAPRGRGMWPLLAVFVGVAGAVGAAGWWFLLRQPPAPAKPAIAAAPPPIAVPPPMPPQAAAPAPVPSPEPARTEPPKTEAPKAEPPTQAATPTPETKPAEPPPAVAKAPEPPAEKPAAKPAAKPAEPAKPVGVKGLIAQARKLRDRGKSAQALDLYGKAVAIDGQNAEALAGRGWCYLELSQYAPAEASFQSALEADPEGADALLGLAETLRYEGRRADAVKFYERYLAAHPDGEDAVAARNAIKSLKE